MASGKPLVVDPNVQQFEYVTQTQPFGSAATSSNIQTKGVMTTSAIHSQPQKVIVVSSLDDLKRLQSAGFHTSPGIRAPVVSQSAPCLNYVSNSAKVESVNTNVPGHEEGSSGEPASGMIEQQTNAIISAEVQEEEVPEVDISVNNVVSSFGVRCHLNLRRVALEGINVIYKRENNMVNMKLRRPTVTASIWSSGKITCTGATSEPDAKTAARRVARILQKQGYRVRFSNFRVVNVLGTCSLPFAIKIASFAQQNSKSASYEPELHPGVTYKIKDLKATLKVFSTGSITITAPSVHNLQMAVEHIYPLVYEFRLNKKKLNQNELKEAQKYMNPGISGTGGGRDKYKKMYTYQKRDNESEEDDESWSEQSEDD